MTTVTISGAINVTPQSSLDLQNVYDFIMARNTNPNATVVIDNEGVKVVINLNETLELPQ